MATATIETRLVRATSSRKATELATEYGNQFNRIVIGERPAPASEGWIRANCEIHRLEGYISEIYYKTATLYGASALYVRPITGDGVTTLIGECRLLEQCKELAYWTSQSDVWAEGGYTTFRVLEHVASGRYFVVTESNNDDYFQVCATEAEARNQFDSLVAEADYQMSDESFTD